MKKGIIIIIILFVLCVVILGAFARYRYLESLKNRDELYEYNEFAKKLHEEENKEMLKPAGIFLLNRAYKGDNDIDDFYRELRTLAEENKSKIGVKKVTPETVKVTIDTDSFKDVTGGVEFNITLSNAETNESIGFKVTLQNVLSRNFVEFEEIGQ